MADAAEALFGSQTISPHGGPLYLQLKRGIEDAVRRGAIKPGDALPSERDLAARVEISRVQSPTCCGIARAAANLWR